jgi:hypothetical protein
MHSSIAKITKGVNMKKVTYSSNNSGGNWWLLDSHWQRLEDAGWYVMWGGNVFCNLDPIFAKGSGANKAPGDCPLEVRNEHLFNTCKGHRAYDSLDAVIADNGQWLGSAAREASKDFPTLKDAILEWEEVTGMDAADEGCNCCGAPHSFSTSDPYEYVSGDDVVSVLFDTEGMSLRDMAKKLRGKK